MEGSQAVKDIEMVLSEKQSGVENERRHVSDSELRDRRVIRRFTDPHLRTYARLVRIVCQAWMAFTAVYFVLYAMYGSTGRVSTARTFFIGVTLLSVVVAVHRLNQAVKSYLQNESQARLAIAIERLFLLLFVVVVVSIIFGTAHVISFL